MNDDKVNVQIPTEHAPLAMFGLWLALGEAMRMLGESRGNDGWREELYESVQTALLENTRKESGGDPGKLVELEAMLEPEAMKSCSRIIDAAFDRIKFK